MEAQNNDNYRYTNTGLHIITPKECVKNKITLEQYLNNPFKYKFFTEKNTILEVIKTVSEVEHA